jgi:hypothetical protein
MSGAWDVLVYYSLTNIIAVTRSGGIAVKILWQNQNQNAKNPNYYFQQVLRRP